MLVKSYYFPEHQAAGQAVLQASAQAVQIFSEKFGPPPPDKAMEGRISAHQAWGMVMSGLERGVCPKDQGIRETVRRIGGWDWLSGQSYDDLHWLEKRFLDHFRDLSDTQKYHQLKYDNANLLEEPKE